MATVNPNQSPALGGAYETENATAKVEDKPANEKDKLDAISLEETGDNRSTLVKFEEGAKVFNIEPKDFKAALLGAKIQPGAKPLEALTYVDQNGKKRVEYLMKVTWEVEVKTSEGNKTYTVEENIRARPPGAKPRAEGSPKRAKDIRLAAAAIQAYIQEVEGAVTTKGENFESLKSNGYINVRAQLGGISYLVAVISRKIPIEISHKGDKEKASKKMILKKTEVDNVVHDTKIFRRSSQSGIGPLTVPLDIKGTSTGKATITYTPDDPNKIATIEMGGKTYAVKIDPKKINEEALKGSLEELANYAQELIDTIPEGDKAFTLGLNMEGGQPKIKWSERTVQQVVVEANEAKAGSRPIIPSKSDVRTSKRLSSELAAAAKIQQLALASNVLKEMPVEAEGTPKEAVPFDELSDELK